MVFGMSAILRRRKALGTDENITSEGVIPYQITERRDHTAACVGQGRSAWKPMLTRIPGSSCPCIARTRTTLPPEPVRNCILQQGQRPGTSQPRATPHCH